MNHVQLLSMSSPPPQSAHQPSLALAALSATPRKSVKRKMSMDEDSDANSSDDDANDPRLAHQQHQHQHHRQRMLNNPNSSPVLSALRTARTTPHTPRINTTLTGGIGAVSSAASVWSPTVVSRSTLFKRTRVDDAALSNTVTPGRLAGPHCPLSHDSASVSSGLPLACLLDYLTKEQLVDVVSKLVLRNPGLIPEVRNLLPRPTLQTVAATLSTLEKKVADSFPFSRGGPVLDDYSFGRVRPAMIELRGAISSFIEYYVGPLPSVSSAAATPTSASASAPSSASGHALDPNEDPALFEQYHPVNAFAFLHLASSTAERLPNWPRDQQAHIKHSLISDLNLAWLRVIRRTAALVQTGRMVGQQSAQEWAHHLAEHNAAANGAYQSALTEFVDSLGWAVGMTRDAMRDFTSQHAQLRFHAPMPTSLAQASANAAQRAGSQTARPSGFGSATNVNPAFAPGQWSIFGKFN